MSPRHFFSGLVLVILATTSARAFEGYEHSALGIYGLSWARLLIDHDDRWKRNSEAVREIDQLVKQLLDPTRDHLATYGDWVKVVDFVQTPDECLPVDLVRSTEDNTTWVSLPPDKYHLAARLKVKAKLHSFRSWANSSHNNLDHFQRRAQNQYARWHFLALQEAVAGKGHLWMALWYEAFADHFLQDSMAPGHVRTPRNMNLVDVAAVAMHDYFNRQGEDFEISPQHRLPYEQLAAIRDELLTDESKLGLRADSNDEGLLSEELDADELAQLATGKLPEKIHMFGDAFLKRTPEGDLNTRQKLFLITITAASIADVLDAYLGQELPKAPYIALEDFKWERGQFEAHTTFTFQPKEIITQKTRLITSFGRYEPEEYGEIPFNSALALAVEFNYQSLLAHDTGSDRAEVIGEFLAWGGAEEHENKDASQRGALVGYSALLDRSVFRKGQILAHGPAFKYVVPMPEVGSQVYTFGGFRRYKEGGETAWRPYGGLGGEIGFSLCFLRFNVSAENFYRDARWHYSPAITFGIGGTISWNRMRAWFQSGK